MYSRRSTSPAMSGWERMRSMWAGSEPMEAEKQQNVQYDFGQCTPNRFSR